jgi:hypothetical protein
LLQAASPETYGYTLVRYGLDGRGSIPGRGNDFFFLRHRVQTPIQWVPVDSFSGVNRPGREADHSSLSSGVIKSAWSHISIPSYVSTARHSVKHRGQFYLTFCTSFVTFFCLPPFASTILNTAIFTFSSPERGGIDGMIDAISIDFIL